MMGWFTALTGVIGPNVLVDELAHLGPPKVALDNFKGFSDNYHILFGRQI